MKKTFYTLVVNNYEPEMTKLTFPLMQRYADKIQADFVCIKDRKWPDLPPVVEKFQIYDLAEERGDDWSIYFDADTLIHPNLFDVTAVLTKDTTCSNGRDFIPIRWRPNRYFLRDGRWEGKGNWCAIASDWCRDYWNPDEIKNFDRWVEDIHPTVYELNTVVKRDHLIDDLFISINIAKFGLKHVLIPQLCQKYGAQPVQFPPDVDQPQGGWGFYLWHKYTIPPEQKIIEMKKVIQFWGVTI
jgi:hypothetical protein